MAMENPHFQWGIHLQDQNPLQIDGLEDDYIPLPFKKWSQKFQGRPMFLEFLGFFGCFREGFSGWYLSWTWHLQGSTLLSRIPITSVEDPRTRVGIVRKWWFYECLKKTWGFSVVVLIKRKKNKNKRGKDS